MARIHLGWNTKISARETNYGTRIDYVLVTPGLLPWLKAGDIQPSIKGSDHCPVFVDLHDEITTESGEKLVLRDLMYMSADAAKREPPRLAAKHWPEFQGKQTLMSSFFVKRAAETSPPPPTTPTVPPNGLSVLVTAFDALDTQLPPPPLEEPLTSKATQTHSSSSQANTEPEPSTPPSSVSPAASQPSSSLKPPQEPRESRKRPRTDAPAAGNVKQKKLEAGQTRLSSFFTKPTTTATTTAAPRQSSSSSDRVGWCPSSEIIDLCEDSEEMPSSLPTITSEIRLPTDNTSNGTSSSSLGKGKEDENGKTRAGAASWSALFTPTPSPLCNVHREPAKEWRVNKPGPNKGKTFFLCSRPVGPGYDKGRTERLREEVDPRYKCNFFMWSSDARREAMRVSASGGAASTRTSS
jgi:AP endonuclease 2